MSDLTVALAPACDRARVDRALAYRVLGPIEVAEGPVVLPLAGGKARALLARLLLDVNRTVSVDAIVDALWSERVPSSATKMVHVYVSQLRKVLPAGALRTRAPGYALDVAPEAVDLVRFTRLRAEGRAALADGDATTASARLRAGLALWRGAALAELTEPFAAAHAAHLEELRLASLEDRIEADLALGHHADVIGELRFHIAAHPLRERPRCQLMLALYRAGRQAEALAVYHEYRATLSDELGVEPGAAIRELQRQVLNQDPRLDGEARPLAIVEPLGGAVDPAPRRLVGRTAELALLDRAFAAAAAGRGTTALVAGPAGIGKTLLAGEAAERARRGGATVLTGGCIDLVGAGLPYLALVEAMRPLCGSPLLEQVRGELRELPKLHPDLHPDLAGLAATPGDGAAARARLFSEVAAVLEHLSRGAPLVLVLEDLHWADAATLDLIAYLAHALAERRVLVVGTYRTDAAAPAHALHRLVAGLRRAPSTVTVELGPLQPEEIDALVRATVELAPDVAEAVCARADGNPFFALELATAAANGEAGLPPTLQDLLAATVAGLDANARALLRVIAAADHEVPFALRAAVNELQAYLTAAAAIAR